jgi:spore coat polysaccharide biosynthesis predicted glycosyltransferase SpsG
MERLIIRVDASAQIGTGHLMRYLALVQYGNCWNIKQRNKTEAIFD